jgi:hypothetical protein
LENAAQAVRDFYEPSPEVSTSAMKVRAVAFGVFDHHPCLYHPLASSPGEGFVLPDQYFSQHDWMLVVTPEVVNQMVEGPQDRWQDQVPGGWTGSGWQSQLTTLPGEKSER